MKDFADNARPGSIRSARPIAATRCGRSRRPGQGIAVLEMLNILEGYDLTKMGRIARLLAR